MLICLKLVIRKTSVFKNMLAKSFLWKHVVIPTFMRKSWQ